MRVTRLTVICAIALVVPGVASAASATGVAVTVTTGTTIYQPAQFDLGIGRPGDSLAAGRLTIAWLSNDDAMSIVVMASDLVCVGPPCVAGPAPDAIASAAVMLLSPGPAAPLDRLRVLATVAGDTGDAPESASLDVSVLVPEAPPGHYAGTLDFAVVEPAVLASAGCASADAVPGTAPAAVSLPCAVTLSDLPAAALRVFARADGGSTVATPFTLTVR